jgi:uncharacterized protein (TIGR02453 family)
MKTVAINNSTLKFLSDIAENNNRDWFQTNKTFILKHKKTCIPLLTILSEIINMTNSKLDLQKPSPNLQRHEFSKDKLPYHAKFDFGLKRSGKQRRGGYYMNIKPGNSYLACGFFCSKSEDLKKFVLIHCRNTQWCALLNQKQSNPILVI